MTGCHVRADAWGLTQEARDSIVKRYGYAPFQAYMAQRGRARIRKISWEMTFAEWWKFWGEKYKRRGRAPNALCMARRGDAGPYSVANCYICTNKKNRASAQPAVSAAIQAFRDKK